jgi:hypothetical protein
LGYTIAITFLDFIGRYNEISIKGLTANIPNLVNDVCLVAVLQND